MRKFIFIILLCCVIAPAKSYGFSILSYNVAEISEPSELRISRLLSGIFELSPDIILLQEVESITQHQLEQVSVNHGYKISALIHHKMPAGGLVTLVKKNLEIENWRYDTLPSEMGRGFLQTDIALAGILIHVINVHLESPDLLFWRADYFRERQIQALEKLTANFSDYFIAGDFNLWEGDKLEKQFPAVWQDVWLNLYPKDAGLTWNPKRNELAWKSGGFIFSGARFDRIFLMSKTIKPVKMCLIGTNTSPPLSDHFGIFAEFMTRP